MARSGENADNMAAAVAPPAMRKNSRRLHEIACSMSREDPELRTSESLDLSLLPSFCVPKGFIYYRLSDGN
jgi:hypothetical protein